MPIGHKKVKVSCILDHNRFIRASFVRQTDKLSFGKYVVSSVRSSSGNHGLIEIRSAAAAAAQATFSNFSNSSDSKVKVKVKGPNMCYIFEKHGIQGYRI